MDSVVSYNTRSAVRRRIELLERGQMLSENKSEVESDMGNTTPANLNQKFEQAAEDDVQTPRIQNRHHLKTPDTERR